MFIYLFIYLLEVNTDTANAILHRSCNNQ